MNEMEIWRRLSLLGIETLEELQQFSKDDLVVQFGQEGLRLWELCRGIEEQRVVVEEVEESLEVRCAIEEFGSHVVERLFSMMRSAFCIQMEALFDGERVEVNFSKEVSGRRAYEILLGRMNGRRFAHPESVTLRIVETLPIAYRQLSLFGKEEGVVEACRKFEKQPAALLKVVWDDRTSRLPERRAHLQSLLKRDVTRPLLEPKRTSIDWNDVSVLERWKIKEEWWAKPIERTYYRIVNLKGAFLRVFSEREQWFVH